MNFKLIIENILQKIDNFFKEKPQKEVYMVYIMIIALSFSAAYSFYDLSTNEFMAQRKVLNEINAKINEDKSYLNANPQEKVTQIEAEIKKFEEKLISQKEKNSYIKNKIETISPLVYNEKAWGAYLNSISLNAKEHNIKIVNFTNSYSENNDSSFGHVLDISLKIKGEYLNTVKFINSLEQSELVIDIHDFSISAQDSLKSDINISVWGITYQ
jgi:Tfp pilus assembly protein PilO